MTSDWQSSHQLKSLKSKIIEQDNTTKIVQNIAGSDIKRAWVKKGVLLVVLVDGVWSVPAQSRLFEMLPVIETHLKCTLSGVKIKKHLQKVHSGA